MAFLGGLDVLRQRLEERRHLLAALLSRPYHPDKRRIGAVGSQRAQSGLKQDLVGRLVLLLLHLRERYRCRIYIHA